MPKTTKDASQQRAAREAPSAALVLDAALHRAEQHGWDSLRLRELAADLGVPLSEILVHYRDADAIADAWFRRALTAMLAPPPEGFAALPAQERLRLTMLRWFDALAPHRRVTGEMLAGKAYPSHPHHWVPMIFNLSRTIHWLRDATGLDAAGRRRQVEEVGLTALFLATLRDWLRDETPDQERTKARLARRLAGADRLMASLFRGTPAGPSPEDKKG